MEAYHAPCTPFVIKDSSGLVQNSREEDDSLLGGRKLPQQAMGNRAAVTRAEGNREPRHCDGGDQREHDDGMKEERTQGK